MTCEDVQFAIAADPKSAAAEHAAHLRECPACAAYADEMRELDQRLLAAMRLPVPPSVLEAPVPEPDAATVTPIAAARRERVPRPMFSRFALAASVAVACIVGGVLWGAYPRETLAAAVVEHMAEEPDAWRTTATVLPEQVQRVMVGAGVRLRPGTMDVTYASFCEFRGRGVPHLVVRSPNGPVTVMVLPAEKSRGRRAFDEGGYRGVIVPAERGAIAVLARDGDRTDVDAVAAQAGAAIEYVK
jgi:hypothetical protein